MPRPDLTADPSPAGSPPRRPADNAADPNRPAPNRPEPDGAPTHDFEDLSAGGKTVIIRFGEVCYELKRTRSNRLVLNK